MDRSSVVRYLTAAESSLTRPLYRTMVALLCATVVLVAVVAWSSRLNAFPDENLHVSHASYYINHWVPPPMDRDTMRPYVGAHGYSYFMVWPPQAAYFLYAKAVQLFAVAAEKRWVAYRALCVVLWALLLGIVLPKLRRYPALLLAVGLTSQVWYVFTYFSPDALSYLAAIAVVLQLGLPDSLARRFIETGRPRLGALAIGASVAALALSKLNYMTFAVCAAVYAGLLLWRMRETPCVFQRAAACSVIAVALAGPFLVVDCLENGTARAHGIDELREELASPGFRPSDVKAGKAYYGLALRERGIGAAALFHRPWRWGLLTFRSLFGVYGTMDVISPPGVYGLQHLVTIVLFGWLLWWRRRPLQHNQVWFVVLCVTMLIATFAAAFWRAWVFDFQAQGRYVFAVIPISTLLLLDITEQQEDAGTWACGIALVAAGLCSLGFALPRLM